MNYLFKIIKSFVDGFFPLFGLTVAIVVAHYVYQHGWGEFTQLPIIQEITDNYQRGFEATGLLGEGLIIQVIDLESEWRAGTEQTAATGRPSISSLGTTWSAKKIEKKLLKEGWSKGKMKGAYAYLVYIEEYLGEALYDMEQTGVSASITLAQGILESDAGRSNLARKTNNHFGIKALPTKEGRKKIRARRYAALTSKDFRFKPPAYGVSQHHDDHKYDRFEVYESVRDSYRRHSNLLLNQCTRARKGCYRWIWKNFPVQRERIDIRAKAWEYEPVSGYAPEDFFGETTLPYYAAQAAGLKMAGYATSKTYHKKLVYLIETYELYRLDTDLMRAKNPTL